jgi:hypothetical protein
VQAALPEPGVPVPASADWQSMDPVIVIELVAVLNAKLPVSTV